MRIRKIHISSSVKYKILSKHGIRASEVYIALQEGNPKFRSCGRDRHIALCKKHHYLTIIFKYHNGLVEIKTAYPSSDWQKRSYEKR